MRRAEYKKYLFLGFTLFILITLPFFLVERVRTFVFSAAFPLWKTFTPKEQAEIKKLESENYLLKHELLKYNAEKNIISANVIYRDPASWSNCLWIDVGSDSVSKNCPVIYGKSVVGAIDFVSKKQARVRLITDCALHPSVRVLRGAAQNGLLIEKIESLERTISLRPDLEIEKGPLLKKLSELKNTLSKKSEHWYLAKGILQGAGSPLFRLRNQTLKGIGFNYDFDDEKGEAKDLIHSKMPLIQLGDLLVTTGMDGVFPPDLKVAEVTKIYPLQEGAYTYEIEAKPTCGNLDELRKVFILPPVGYDERQR